ncbi:MAG: TlpA disulfide reductase family protein [Candidatus Sedimenticola sp. 6PFRAG7]
MLRRDFLLAMGLVPWKNILAGHRNSGPLEPLKNGGMVPDFVLSDLQGNEHRPGDFQGRVLIINFWATWCPPCRAEMPSMGRMLENFKGSPISLLAVAMSQKHKQVQQFADKHPQPFPLLPDADGKVSAAFNVQGLPTTYLADKNGRLVYRVQGGREWDSERMTRAIELLL